MTVPRPEPLHTNIVSHRINILLGEMGFADSTPSRVRMRLAILTGAIPGAETRGLVISRPGLIEWLASLEPPSFPCLRLDVSASLINASRLPGGNRMLTFPGGLAMDGTVTVAARDTVDFWISEPKTSDMASRTLARAEGLPVLATVLGLPIPSFRKRLGPDGVFVDGDPVPDCRFPASDILGFVGFDRAMALYNGTRR